MRYLILTDIHGNLPALEAVLADATKRGFDAVLVLGDLVGYGAEPGEVLDRTLALSPANVIRGNHDRVCAGLDSAESFNDIARLSIEWTARTLGADQLARLAALPAGPMRVGETIEIAHGAPFDEDFYVFDHRDAARALASASAPVCFIGHTHVPAVFTAASGGETIDDSTILLPNGPVLINVGAVGQPRDGDPRAAYGLYDTTGRRLELRRVSYDIARAQRAILEAGLPGWLAHRLELGQ